MENIGRRQRRNDDYVFNNKRKPERNV